MFKKLKKGYKKVSGKVKKFQEWNEANKERALQRQERAAARNARRAKIEKQNLELARIKRQQAQERAAEWKSRMSGFESLDNMFSNDLGGMGGGSSPKPQYRTVRVKKRPKRRKTKYTTRRVLVQPKQRDPFDNMF